MGTFLSLDDLPSVDFEHGNFPLFGSKIWSYMKYDTVIYCFYSAKKGIDFGKSLFVLEGINGGISSSKCATLIISVFILLQKIKKMFNYRYHSKQFCFYLFIQYASENKLHLHLKMT